MWKMMKEFFKFLSEVFKATTHGLEEINRGLDAFNKEMDQRKVSREIDEFIARSNKQLADQSKGKKND